MGVVQADLVSGKQPARGVKWPPKRQRIAIVWPSCFMNGGQKRQRRQAAHRSQSSITLRLEVHEVPNALHLVEQMGLFGVLNMMEIMTVNNFDGPRARVFKSGWGCRINSDPVQRQYWAEHDVSQNQKIGVQP
jgi:hypothetical protein